MTFEELELRMAQGERIGQAIDAHDAIAAIVNELRKVQMVRGAETESTEQAWEHAGEFLERRKT